MTYGAIALPTTRISLLEQAQGGGSEQALLQILELASNFIALRVRQLRARYPSVGQVDADSAAQAAQQNILKAIVEKKFVHPGTGQHAFHPYLSQIVHNCFMNELRLLFQARQIGDREVGTFPVDEDGRTLEVPDEEPGPAEHAEHAERKELNNAWCLAVALQSLGLARCQFFEPTGGQVPSLRLLAWQGYCLMTFENLSRDEVLNELRKRFPIEQRDEKRLTTKWLSDEAHKIRVLNAKCFLEICHDVGYEVTRYEMRDGLDALAAGMRLEAFHDALKQEAGERHLPLPRGQGGPRRGHPRGDGRGPGRDRPEPRPAAPSVRPARVSARVKVTSISHVRLKISCHVDDRRPY